MVWKQEEGGWRLEAVVQVVVVLEAVVLEAVVLEAVVLEAVVLEAVVLEANGLPHTSPGQRPG
jgi:hypothetical protein